MVARAVPPATVIKTNDDPVTIKQDYSADGALVVTPDTAQQWPVKLQAIDPAGYLRDLKVSPKGELITASADHVILQSNYSGTPAANTVFIGPVPAEGFVSASVLTSAIPSGGMYLQVSYNGVDWVSVTTVLNSGSTASTGMWNSGQIYTASLPPCAFVRLMTNASSALTGVKFFLALSKTQRPDYLAARLSDVQVSDSLTPVIASSVVQQLLVGGVDSAKRTRALATDGTVYAKAQAPANNQTGAALNIPYYGHVMAQAIARIAPYPYSIDQPAALQANTRGELQVDQQEIRRIQEQQLLAQQAAAMQQLDPNWGFELR